MKLTELFRTAIEIGMKNDIRQEDEIKELLEERKKEVEENSKKPIEEQKHYSEDYSWNIFDDSKILNKTDNENITHAYVGIDIDVSEALLVRELNKEKKDNKDNFNQINLLWAHHPSGKPLVELFKVMDLQKYFLFNYGISPSIAEFLLSDRTQEVMRRFLPFNAYKTIDAVQKLGLNFINTHTPADNMVTKYLLKLFEEEKPRKTRDVIKLLLNIKEYEIGKKLGFGPVIINGKLNNTAGKIHVDMTGGTEGPQEYMQELVRAGVSTIVGMHFSEDHIKKAKEAKVNLIIAGHMPSDSLGMNLLMDAVMKKLKEEITITPGSGFIRVKREALDYVRL